MLNKHRRFVIWGNTEKDEFWNLMPKVVAWAKKRDFTVVITTRIQAAMKQELDFPCEILNSADEFPNSEFVLSLGGDGTFLSAAQAVRHRQVPILGIHLGDLGFLAQVTAKDIFTRLDQIASGEYDVEQQLVLVGTTNNEDSTESWFAVNDFVMNHSHSHRMLSCRAYANGRLIGNYKADGMIVSTPVGSTAYSLSAGGPIVQPGVQSVVVTPICPHTLTSRPLVLSSKVKLEFAFPEDHRDPVSLSSDGQMCRDLEYPERFLVSLANFTIPFITFKDKSYYRTLRRKMGWGKRGDQEFPETTPS